MVSFIYEPAFRYLGANFGQLPTVPSPGTYRMSRLRATSDERIQVLKDGAGPIIWAGPLYQEKIISEILDKIYRLNLSPKCEAPLVQYPPAKFRHYYSQSFQILHYHTGQGSSQNNNPKLKDSQSTPGSYSGDSAHNSNGKEPGGGGGSDSGSSGGAGDNNNDRPATKLPFKFSLPVKCFYSVQSCPDGKPMCTSTKSFNDASTFIDHCALSHNLVARGSRSRDGQSYLGEVDTRCESLHGEALPRIYCTRCYREDPCEGVQDFNNKHTGCSRPKESSEEVKLRKLFSFLSRYNPTARVSRQTRGAEPTCNNGCSFHRSCDLPQELKSRQQAQPHRKRTFGSHNDDDSARERGELKKRVKELEVDNKALKGRVDVNKWLERQLSVTTDLVNTLKKREGDLENKISQLEQEISELKRRNEHLEAGASWWNQDFQLPETQEPSSDPNHIPDNNVRPDRYY